MSDKNCEAAKKLKIAFQYSILRGSCISNCLKRNFGDHWQDQRIEETLEQDFEQRIPYQYLNVAYYQVGKLKGIGPTILSPTESQTFL